MSQNSPSDQDQPAKDYFLPIWHNAWHDRQAQSGGYPTDANVMQAIIMLARRSTTTEVKTRSGWVTVPLGGMWGKRQDIADEAVCSVRSVGRSLGRLKAAGLITTRKLYGDQEPGSEQVKCIGLLIVVQDWEDVVAQGKGVSGGRTERPRRPVERPAVQAPGAAGAKGGDGLPPERNTKIDPNTLTFEDRDWGKYRRIFANLPHDLTAAEEREWEQARRRFLREQQKVMVEQAGVLDAKGS